VENPARGLAFQRVQPPGKVAAATIGRPTLDKTYMLKIQPRHIRHRREIAIALAILALWIVVAFTAPGFFAVPNQRDIWMANMPVLIGALGMTLIILTGQIDISIGSQFAICGVAAGLLAKSGLPLPAVALAVLLAGAGLGAINGALVAWVRIPSIVVTLATMV